MGAVDSQAVPGFKSCLFFKQWGGVRKDRTGRQLNGRTYDEMPKVRRTISIELAA